MNVESTSKPYTAIASAFGLRVLLRCFCAGLSAFGFSAFGWDSPVPLSSRSEATMMSAIGPLPAPPITSSRRASSTICCEFTFGDADTVGLLWPSAKSGIRPGRDCSLAQRRAFGKRGLRPVRKASGWGAYQAHHAHEGPPQRCVYRVQTRMNTGIHMH